MTTIHTRPRLALVAMLGTLALTIGPAPAQTRTLETSFGPVDIPANPTRIVTTHNIATQPLIELGVVPVGRGDVAEGSVLPENWALIADVPTVTLEGGEPNYEQIAALEPDLIFEINVAAEQRIERLQQIAPVVLIGIGGQDRALWQNRARQIADAVGALDAWEANEAEFIARQDEIASQYGDVAARHPIAIWDVWEFGIPAVYPSNTMVGRILEPAGAVFGPASEAMASELGEEVEFSNEQLGAVLGDAEVLFYGTAFDMSVYPETDETRALEVYQKLPAVAAGHDYPLGKLTISGYSDARAVLDNYAELLSTLE